MELIRIDCDADPIIPEHMELIEHAKGGIFDFDINKIVLCLSTEQERIGSVNGNRLLNGLRGKHLNANVLFYLLSNQELIPDKWKGLQICFFGTVYRYFGTDAVILYLVWFQDKWQFNCFPINRGYSKDWLVAILK
jgi:hypothetical protein